MRAWADRSETEQTYAYLSHDPAIHPKPYRTSAGSLRRRTTNRAATTLTLWWSLLLHEATSRAPNPSDDPKLRALDGTPGRGACHDGPMPHGSFYCTVKHGTIRLAGIIVD